MQVSDKMKYRIELVRNSILRGQRLYDFAIGHRYGDVAINILSNKGFSEKTLKCFEQQETSKTFTHRKDDRSTFEYNLNLILGWVIEDYIVDNSSGIFTLNGSDKEREILCTETKITNMADLWNTISNKPVEVHTEYFARSEKNKGKTIMLRDNKYKNLYKENAEILIINIPTRTYMLKNIKDFNALYIPEYKDYGNKPVYSLNLTNIDNEYKPLDILFHLLHKRAQKENLQTN